MTRSFPTILAFLLFLSTFTACSSSEETASADKEDQKDEEEAEKLDEEQLKARKLEVKKGDIKEIEKADTAEKNKGGSGKSEVKSGKKGDYFAVHKRTPCYGQCPTYTLKIRADGKAKLKVEGFMELEEGSYKGKVKKTELEKIRGKAEAIDFFEMQEEYDNPDITDLPSRITELSFEDRSHKVRNRHGGPDRLKELEERFARIVEETDWSPSSTE